MARTIATARPEIANLLKNNPSFERVPSFTANTTTKNRWIDGTTGGLTTDAYGWALADKGGSGETFFDTSEYHSGKASLKVSTTATASYMEIAPCPNLNVASYRRYTPTVLPSTAYTLSYWMKTNVGSGTATNGATLVANERSVTGTSLASNNGAYIKTTTNWTKYTVNFTTNASTNFITIQPRVYGHQGTATLIMDAWFDDVSLTLAAPTARATNADSRKPLTPDVSDHFTRADSVNAVGTTEVGGLAWTAVSGTWGISSNQVYLPSATADAFICVNPGNADVDLSLMVATHGNEPGLYFRAADTSNYWRLLRSSTTLVLQKRVANVLSTVLTANYNFTNGDIYRVRANGSNLDIYINDALKGCVVDSDLATNTKHGLGNGSATNSTVSRFDDFEITYL